MNAHLPFHSVPDNEKTSWLKRLLQEPLIIIVVVWALMLAFVGLCFAFVD